MNNKGPKIKGRWILLALIIIYIPYWIMTSDKFEKIPPKITFTNIDYWNLKKPFQVTIEDQSGLKYYKVLLITDHNTKSTVLVKNDTPILDKKVVVDIKVPVQLKANDKISIRVEAVDNSYWHWFSGNESVKTKSLTIDMLPPSVEVIDNSYAIGKGGSAVAIVNAKDLNLAKTYVLVNDKYKFNLVPFYKQNYYIALIAWPIIENKFKAYLVAEDKAGNISKRKIRYYWRSYKYPSATINITDKFIDNVVNNVLEEEGFEDEIAKPNSEKFKFMNEYIRKLNEQNMFNWTRKIRENYLESFRVRRFRPMAGKEVAPYGEHRTYKYKNDIISHAIHKGRDIARIKHSKVYLSNDGYVVSEKYNGIYGNTLVIYHGLGLYSTYSHLSKFLVDNGEEVTKNQVIAITGSTGAVFGDHLHFGVYIQGYPVNPKEWMDQRWVKQNILDIILDAKRIINNQ